MRRIYKSKYRRAIIGGVTASLIVLLGCAATLQAPLSHAMEVWQYQGLVERNGATLTDTHSAAFDTNDNMWIAYGTGSGNGADSLVELSPSGAELNSFPLQACTASGWFYVTGIVYDDSENSINVSLDNTTGGMDDAGCVEEYAPNGTQIAMQQVGHGAWGIADDQANGTIFVADGTTGAVFVYADTDLSPLSTLINARGSGDGQLLFPRSMVVLGSTLWINDYGNSRLEAFNVTTGDYVAQFTTDTNGGNNDLGLATDVSGNLYTVNSLGGIRVYNQSGTLLRSTTFNVNLIPGYNGSHTPSSIAVDANNGTMYVNATSPLSEMQGGEIMKFTYIDMSPPNIPANLQIDASHYLSGGDMTLSWNTPANTTTSNPVTKYFYTVTSPYAVEQQMGNIPNPATLSVTIQHANIRAGLPYTAAVYGWNAVGVGPTATIQFIAPGVVGSMISGVSFGTDGSTGNKTLIATGWGFVSYGGALHSSIVQLNGHALPFCSYNVGATAAQLVTSLGLDSSLVSDNPPCYLVLDTSSELVFTSGQFIIELPSNFNTTATGTLTTYGSNTYTFNPYVGPPTAFVDGDKPFDRVPTVPSRPTFSGIARPYSHIVVTVHSNPVTCEADADSTGNWSCTLADVLPSGTHTATVVVTNPDSTVTTIGPYQVIVASGIGAPDTSIKNVSLILDHAGVRPDLSLVALAAGTLTLVMAVIFILRRR